MGRKELGEPSCSNDGEEDVVGGGAAHWCWTGELTGGGLGHAAADRFDEKSRSPDLPTLCQIFW